MAELTLREYIDKMKLKVRKLSETDTPLLLAASSALAQFSTRVFVQGQTIDGGQYQYNDTTPLYLNPRTSIGSFNVGGKPDDKGRRSRKKVSIQKFAGFSKNSLKDVGKKTKVARKTRYFSSYKDYRQEIGRESSFVNWNLGNDLKSEIENRASGRATPRKVGDGYQVSVNSEENSGKLKGLMEKYPGVFQFSSSEKTTFFTDFEKEILRIIQS